MIIKYNRKNIIRAIESCVSRIENYMGNYNNICGWTISEGHEKKILNQIEIELVKIEALYQLLNNSKDEDDI